MPKISRSGGAAHAAAGPSAGSVATGVVVEDVPVVVEDSPWPTVPPEREHQLDAPTEGVEIPPVKDDGEGEQSSPGSSSETSPESAPTSPETSESDPPK